MYDVKRDKTPKVIYFEGDMDFVLADVWGYDHERKTVTKLIGRLTGFTPWMWHQVELK